MHGKFLPGQIVATPGALKALEESGQTPGEFLALHLAGDWGDELSGYDKLLNDLSLEDGSRLLSSYRTTKGEKIWIITEAEDDTGKRVATTVLLPTEY